MLKLKEYYSKIKIFLSVHEYFAAVLFFLILISIFFFPVVFQGKTLTTSVFGGGVIPSGAYGYEGVRPPFFTVRDPGAFDWVDEPLSNYIGKIIKEEKRIPLWNPNMGLGYPLLGGTQLGIFFPLNYIVFLFSSELAWDVLMLFRLFLAGFATYLFVRMIGLNKKPAFLAGVIFMFNGYAMGFINMAHYSSEALIPLLLLSYEYFLLKPNIKRFFLSVIVTSLVIFPGMPEASFFALLIGSLWFIFSSLLLHRKKIGLWRALIFFAAINIFALLLCSVQLLPFAELLRNSFNSHSNSSVGLSSIHFDTISSIFYPLIFNIIHAWIGSFYYLGVSSVILAILSFFGLNYLNGKERKIFIFFALFAFLGIAKFFGAPFINWIGLLPILNTLIFPKYQAPSIIFAISIIAAFGYSLVLNKKIRHINAKLALLFVGFLLLTVYSFRGLSKDFDKKLGDSNATINNITNFIINHIHVNIPSHVLVILQTNATIYYFVFAILSGVILFLCFWIILINANLESKNKYFKTLILLFVILEFYIYSFPLVRADRYDTYKEPPFVQFLENDKNDVFRIFSEETPGQGVLLYPNISSVFGIQDIRYLIALSDGRYSEFLTKVVGVSKDEINAIRFIGTSPLELNSKYLDLMNTKYFLVFHSFNQDNTLNDIDSSKTVTTNVSKFVARGNAVLNGKNLSGLMLHAPSEIEFPYYVSKDNKELNFEYGIADSGVERSNGVRFIVDYYCDGKTREAINDLVDPQNNKYLSWQEASLDLSECVGEEAKITFKSEDNGNNEYDHFFLGNFLSAKAKIVYDDGETEVLKNSDYLPRTFVVHRAEKIFEPEKIFDELKDSNFDIRENIIIEKDLPDSQLTGNESPVEDGSTAKISDYKDEQVKIDANMQNPGFLVLLDQYYPGWKAFVDGKEAEIYPTDYVFRSIYLEKGKHKVEFIYDPLSYKIGKYITLATILLLIIAYIFREKIDRGFFRKES